MMTLKPPSFSPIRSSKSLKINNYDKAPYIISSYCQFPQVNLFARIIHLMLLIQTNLSRLHQQTNKQLLNCTFSKSLTNT